MIVTGPPSKPVKLGFTALNFTSATLFWMPPNDCLNCVHSYDWALLAKIPFKNSFNLSYVYNSTTTTSTSLNVTGLSRGVEYTFTVTGRDRAGRKGESEEMSMTLEGI